MIRIVRDWVEMFEPGVNDVKCRRDRQRLLNLLDSTDEPFSRSQFDPGHITVSALLFSPNLEDILLVKHAKLARWLQPGGHVEPDDEDISETARREVAEETCVTLDHEAPLPMVGVDVHSIPPYGEDPPHSHYDIMLAFKALSLEARPSVETPEFAWTPLDEARAVEGLGERLAFCIDRALKYIK